jgi:hypothetical protein
MKKSSKKLTLKAESLRRLDPLARAEAAGAYTPHCSVNYSCPITGCSCPNPSATCP